eukprot:8706656-Karenia_brevis.AAC.1
MDAPPSSAPAKRPNRSAAQRRLQYQRAHARTTARLLEAFGSLEHRGNLPARVHSQFVQTLGAMRQEHASADQSHLSQSQA